MAAPGQRIHPAGSRSLDPRHAATFAEGALDATREHDACGVGFVAHASGARSHEVVGMALEAVARVAHRGAASTDNSGDGAGLLTQIPHRLFYRDAYRLGLHLQPGLPFGVGAFFLPREPQALGEAVTLVETVLAEDGIPFLGWRDVPTNQAALGPTARASCPVIRQVLVGRPALASNEEQWEQALYLARREMERRSEERQLPGFYVCSLSCRTIVYKALLTGTQLPAFFTDFRYPEYESAIAVFHQRYSTNTLPSWPLAQPFRLLAHNGEINTLWGNRNAMTMRQPMLASPVWGKKIERLRQVIWRDGSDSASLDNAMELLVRSGRDVVHTTMMMVPQAWEKYSDLDPAVKAFYEYHQCVLEPWDGPAAIAFTDGVLCGASVDRNGLRPSRYKVRRDGLVVSGSEVGLVDLDPREVIECGKVGARRSAGGGHRAGRSRPEPRCQAGGRRPAALRPLGGALHGHPGPRPRPGAARCTRASSSPGCSGASATASRTCASSSSRWAAPEPIRSGAWVTIRRFRRCRRYRRACTPISGSASRRSPTRRSTRCESRWSCRSACTSAGGDRRCSSGPATRGCCAWSTPSCSPRKWPRCETSPVSRRSRSTRCGTRAEGWTDSAPRSRPSAAPLSARRGAAPTS